MMGHHDIKTFSFSLKELHKGYSLPPEWKPFSTHMEGDHTFHVVCRHWVRADGKKVRTM